MTYQSNHCAGVTTRLLLVTCWPFAFGADCGGYTEGMGPGKLLTLQHLNSSILVMERTNLPDDISTSIVLTTLSWPRNSCVITLSGHFNCGCWSSCTRTTEPSWRSHFPGHGGKFLMLSLDQISQNLFRSDCSMQSGEVDHQRRLGQVLTPHRTHQHDPEERGMMWEDSQRQLSLELIQDSTCGVQTSRCKWERWSTSTIW